MRRGNKVRYKKTLKFEIIEGTPNELIISYKREIGRVDYIEQKVFHRVPFGEMTPMNIRHIKWALGRAKNRTNKNGASSPWLLIEG